MGTSLPGQSSFPKSLAHPQPRDWLPAGYQGVPLELGCALFFPLCGDAQAGGDEQQEQEQEALPSSVAVLRSPKAQRLGGAGDRAELRSLTSGDGDSRGRRGVSDGRGGCEGCLGPASQSCLCSEDRRPTEVGGGLQDGQGAHLWSSKPPVSRVVAGHYAQGH